MLEVDDVVINKTVFCFLVTCVTHCFILHVQLSFSCLIDSNPYNLHMIQTMTHSKKFNAVVRHSET